MLDAQIVVKCVDGRDIGEVEPQAQNGKRRAPVFARDKGCRERVEAGEFVARVVARWYPA